MDPTQYLTPEEEYSDWLEECHAFQCDGHEDDLMPPFACGWCGTMVGSNGAQARDCGGTRCVFLTCVCPPEKVPIYLDPQGTAWHTLCAFAREGLL